jgi:radical SAM/Cys-rich protein
VRSLAIASFDGHLESAGLPPLRRGATTTLQLNVTARCNLACHHCHVESGPKRSEGLDGRTVERILELLERSPGIEWLDLTGGAPELSEHFRTLVARGRAAGVRVMDRCNLTVLFEPGQEDTVAFLAEHEVAVVASLPCYGPENVDAQRGKNVFNGSIEALYQLNALGYGKPDSGLELDLVYNPVGPFLPPDQHTLEQRYRAELREKFGIEFNRLFTITNMPIKRFAHSLRRDGQLEAYQGLLVNHFNSTTLDALMCRSLVSVGWDGSLYDCDFNQMLELPLGGRRRTVFDLESFDEVAGERIATGSHCFGCTAGAGSSCGGTLV